MLADGVLGAWLVLTVSTVAALALATGLLAITAGAAARTACRPAPWRAATPRKPPPPPRQPPCSARDGRTITPPQARRDVIPPGAGTVLEIALPLDSGAGAVLRLPSNAEV
jgi:hypothetical protein